MNGMEQFFPHQQNLQQLDSAEIQELVYQVFQACGSELEQVAAGQKNPKELAKMIGMQGGNMRGGYQGGGRGNFGFRGGY
mmetsp:Transcript_16974/g.26144  ORF Transcript_16974/g.26144 Transcript_16974/m.26144 type:complete len:80 (-) Transcript_16974:1867-2106(-)